MLESGVFNYYIIHQLCISETSLPAGNTDWAALFNNPISLYISHFNVIAYLNIM